MKVDFHVSCAGYGINDVARTAGSCGDKKQDCTQWRIKIIRALGVRPNHEYPQNVCLYEFNESGNKMVPITIIVEPCKILCNVSSSYRKKSVGCSYSSI